MARAARSIRTRWQDVLQYDTALQAPQRSDPGFPQFAHFALSGLLEGAAGLRCSMVWPTAPMTARPLLRSSTGTLKMLSRTSHVLKRSCEEDSKRQCLLHWYGGRPITAPYPQHAVRMWNWCARCPGPEATHEVVNCCESPSHVRVKASQHQHPSRSSVNYARVKLPRFDTFWILATMSWRT